MKSKGILTLGMFLNFFFTDAQTCVIAKVAKDAIYVGADSRITWTRGNAINEKYDTLLSSTCKIHNVGSYNFAIAGFFSPKSISVALEQCKIQKSFTSIMDKYVDIYGQYLADSLPFYKQNARKVFDYMYNNKLISEIIFFGYKNKIPVVTRLTFFIKSYTESSINIGYDSTININIVAAGHFDSINDALLNDSTWHGNYAKVISRLISLEAKANPESVGGYIDVIKVTPKGIKWVYKKPECATTNLIQKMINVESTNRNFLAESDTKVFVP